MEVLEETDFHGHSFMRLLIRRAGTGYGPPRPRRGALETVEAENLVPRLWAPHIRVGTHLLVENAPPPLDRLILTDHVWNAQEFAAELSSRFEDAEVEVMEQSLTVAGLRNGVEASVEVDREGLLLFDVATPLRSDDEDLTVDFQRFDEDFTPSEQIVAPGIAASAWIVGAEDRRVPEAFVQAAERCEAELRSWLEHFTEISFFDGRADTYTQLLVTEPRIALDLLDAFIELTRLENTADPTDQPDESDDGGDWA